jgi:hypothetical protein
MPIRYTKTMLKVVTTELDDRVTRSLAQFPELADRTVTIGRTMSAEGTAEAEHWRIRLRVRRRRPVSYFTIGHELTHLLQRGGLAIVPSGEAQCDVWTLVRSELFLDEPPSYLCWQLWRDVEWAAHAHHIRRLCQEAVERRQTSRRYLVWLQDRIERHVRAT